MVSTKAKAGMKALTCVWNSWGLGVCSSGLGPGGRGAAKPPRRWPWKEVFQESVALASSCREGGGGERKVVKKLYYN